MHAPEDSVAHQERMAIGARLELLQHYAQQESLDPTIRQTLAVKLWQLCNFVRLDLGQ